MACPLAIPKKSMSPCCGKNENNGSNCYPHLAALIPSNLTHRMSQNWSYPFFIPISNVGFGRMAFSCANLPFYSFTFNIIFHNFWSDFITAGHGQRRANYRWSVMNESKPIKLFISFLILHLKHNIN